jgi:outer membrane lipoprotein-sorting protein
VLQERFCKRDSPGHRSRAEARSYGNGYNTGRFEPWERFSMLDSAGRRSQAEARSCRRGGYTGGQPCGGPMRYPTTLAALLLAGIVGHAAETAPDAKAIVRAAVDHWRGVSSYSEMSMLIHRPDWERSMTMRAWTKGDDKSLVRVIEPKKDRGNGTLTDDNDMWTFSPKVNRVIKIPSSMMGQSWMGSDFSNKDVSRADDIIDQYDHTLLAKEENEGHTVFVIESVPHEEAAVVWGREVLRIRDDDVLLSQEYYDQDDVLVKTLRTLEIGEMGGRTIAIRQRMAKAEAEDEWTEFRIDSVEFDVDIADNVFTMSNLQNPRE